MGLTIWCPIASVPPTWHLGRRAEAESRCSAQQDLVELRCRPSQGRLATRWPRQRRALPPMPRMRLSCPIGIVKRCLKLQSLKLNGYLFHRCCTQTTGSIPPACFFIKNHGSHQNVTSHRRHVIAHSSVASANSPPRAGFWQCEAVGVGWLQQPGQARWHVQLSNLPPYASCEEAGPQEAVPQVWAASIQQ